MSLYNEIFLTQFILVAVSLIAIFYFNKIPKKDRLQQLHLKIPTYYLIGGLLVWLIGYWQLPHLEYLLGTSWFLSLFITFFLMLLSSQFATKFNLIIAIAFSLLLIVANRFLPVLHNIIILFSLFGIAALFIKYTNIKLKWLIIISLLLCLYDITVMFHFTKTVKELMQIIENTPFRATFSLINFQIGSMDIFLIFLYTLFLYKHYNIKKAIVANIAFIFPLITLPLLFGKNCLIPYLMFLVPIFLTMILIYNNDR